MRERTWISAYQDEKWIPNKDSCLLTFLGMHSTTLNFLALVELELNEKTPVNTYTVCPESVRKPGTSARNQIRPFIVNRSTMMTKPLSTIVK